MRLFFNYIISKLKGHPYTLDARLPMSYLIYLIWKRSVMFFLGYCSFIRKKGILFLAPSAKIKCVKLFKIGKGCSIESGCYVDALSVHGIEFGDHVSLGKNTTIECTGSLLNLGQGLKIGNNVGLGTHGFWGCAGGIEVGDDTIFGNYVSLHSENHNFDDLNVPIRLQGVNRQGIKVGNNCWIGAKVTILDGAIIGDGCVIAAGAVVKGVFPKNCVIGGIPAKILKNR